MFSIAIYSMRNGRIFAHISESQKLQDDYFEKNGSKVKFIQKIDVEGISLFTS